MKALKNALRPLWMAAAKRAARAYVAGETVEEAVATCRRWRRRGVATTIGYWNEGDEPVERVHAAYDACVRVLERGLVEGYVSIKLGALDYRDDLLHPLVRRAAAHGFRVHFDALGPETTDRTNAAILRARALHPDLGCTLPGRWTRSVEDAAWAVANDLAVRVVKGQWADPEAPDRDAREGFAAVVEALAGRARFVAVASHDVALAQRCLARLRAARTPAIWELLHGLPMRKALAHARRSRIPVGVYVPYGASWLPYSLDWVKQHPQVVFWLARDLLGG